MVEDIFQTRFVELLPGLAIGRRRLCRYRHRPRGGDRLYLSDDLLAAAVGVQSLGKESPERVLFAEQATSTKGAVPRTLQFAGRDELAETLTQLADRVMAQSRFLDFKSLTRRTGFAT
jgi:hypothetical protein